MFAIQNNLSQSGNFSDIYKRYLDKRHKIKKAWPVEPPQSYIGDVFHGNIHRHGFYFVDNENKLLYDGLFYANKLQGYAQVFYNDGSDFQGLFKNNLRFGPGIFTYPNGEQDVGLWNGQRLLRLGALNDANLVPRLAGTSSGQLKLLKFRYLVPVCSNREDIAYTILQELGASEEVLKKSYTLYNIEVQNKHNIFFDKKLFNKHFGTDQDCTIDIVSSDEDETNDDTEKEEQKEETPGACSDINVERVRQISEELEFIESRLKIVKKKKVVMEKKVEHCRICCTQEQHESELEPTLSNKKEIDDPDRRDSPIQMDIIAAIRANMAASNDSPIPHTEPKEKCYSITAESAWSSYVEPPPRNSSDDSLNLEDISNAVEEISNDFSDESEPINVASRIQSYLVDTCKCDEVMYPRDLYEMEKELESLTRDVLFFESIKKNLKEKLEMHLQKCQSAKVKTTKISVKDVLAWNNEDYCMRMLKHSFRHRRSEYMVNFKVSDLLAGNRKVFGHPGPHESNCIEFLSACSKGDLREIFKQVSKNEIDSNVCDSKGNNGIFFAAVNRHTEIIRTLVSLGTKLNQQNDEGLFPLSMCILVYIAERYEVEDWEKSFLPDLEPMTAQKEAYKWYPNTSLLNLPEKYQENKSTNDTKLTDERTPYLFDTPCVIPTEEEITKCQEQEFNYGRTKSKVVIQGKTIQDSIKMLLNCGADPNICEAPLPPLVLSVFTEDLSLVESILAATANIDVTVKHDMTCLHVIVSLKFSQANIDICSFLLAYNVNPKLRTSTDHWPEQKAYVLGKDINPDDVVDCGKNPLHILCMRKDFPLDTCRYFEKVATIFSNSNIDFSDKYLGHTPLSLAVLVGNQKLVETITKLNFINPYEILDNNMGTILTIYILKRYEDVIPSNAKEILNFLVDLGVNPLRPIGEFDNAVEFMENEHQVPKGKKKKSLEDRNPAERKGDSQKSLKDYLKELTRDTIIKYIQMQAVENLYNLIEDGLVDHECVTMLIEFLTPFNVMSNLLHLFRYGKIQYDRFDKTICLKLLDMAKEREKEAKLKKDTKKSRTKVSKKDIQTPDHTSMDAYDYNIILDMTDFKMVKRTSINFKLLPPGLDNICKYKVCFHCLKKRDKTLLVCPRCQLIYFCSEVCNKANMKLRTKHTCNILFYGSEFAKLQSPDNSESREDLSKLYGRVQENCEKRLVKKRKEQLEMERQKLKEEMKSDPYGLKQLSRGKGPKNFPKTPTMTTLYSSATAYTESEVDGFADSNKKQTKSATKKTVPAVKSETNLFKKRVLDTADEQECSVAQMRVSFLAKQTNKSVQKHPCREQICECKACVLQEKRPDKIKYKCMLEKKEKAIKEKIETKKGADNPAEDNVTFKKLRQIPGRYQEFVDLLTRYFPEVDFSALFLPYACYSNGHLYYKFLDNDFYTRTYSMM